MSRAPRGTSAVAAVVAAGLAGAVLGHRTASAPAAAPGPEAQAAPGPEAQAAPDAAHADPPLPSQAGPPAPAAPVQDARPQPAPANPAAAPAACLNTFAPIGLPVARGDEVAAGESLICRRGYALAYDPATHDPDWVIEHLTPADLRGPASRANQFKQDPLLGGRDANNADYLRSHYDKGHQAPAGDAKFDQAVMDQSFYFSNMAPQVGLGFNRGAWKYLEETVRSWVVCGGRSEVFVMTGPIYPSSKTGQVLIGADRVLVPTGFYKIVYDVGGGRAVGFILPNQKIGSTIDLQTYVKPIADIETETGLDFFTALPQRTQAQLKLEPGVAWGHVGPCQGDSGE